MPGEYVQGFPNPSNSPNEKFLYPKSSRLVETDLYNDLIAEGIDERTAIAIARSMSRHEERKSLDEDTSLRELEFWANTHTHPGGGGGSSAISPGDWEILGSSLSYGYPTHTLYVVNNRIYAFTTPGTDGQVVWYDKDSGSFGSSSLFSPSGKWSWYDSGFIYDCDIREGGGDKYITRWSPSTGADGQHIIRETTYAAGILNGDMYSIDDSNSVRVIENISSVWVGDNSYFSASTIGSLASGNYPSYYRSCVVSDTPDGIYIIGRNLERTIHLIDPDNNIGELDPLPLFPDEPSGMTYFYRPPGVFYYQENIYFAGGVLTDGSTDFRLGVYRFDLGDWTLHQLSEPDNFRSDTSNNEPGFGYDPMEDTFHLFTGHTWWRSI